MQSAYTAWHRLVVPGHVIKCAGPCTRTQTWARQSPSRCLEMSPGEEAIHTHNHAAKKDRISSLTRLDGCFKIKSVLILQVNRSGDDCHWKDSVLLTDLCIGVCHTTRPVGTPGRCWVFQEGWGRKVGRRLYSGFHGKGWGDRVSRCRMG